VRVIKLLAALGFSPGQFADFVLGFFGLDIGRDNAETQERPASPDSPAAPQATRGSRRASSSSKRSDQAAPGLAECEASIEAGGRAVSADGLSNCGGRCDGSVIRSGQGMAVRHVSNYTYGKHSVTASVREQVWHARCSCLR